MEFENLKPVDRYTSKFTLAPIHVSYANTLRRLILTGVESVAFRADMTSTGSTSDVEIVQNDTPMTNEMLAHRIGLLPINVKQPLKWLPGKYNFTMKVTGDKDNIKHVTASDFEVYQKGESEVDEPTKLTTEDYFTPHPVTRQTCLIATLQPGVGKEQQTVQINAKATIGTGRENARFIPVSQCTYEYTRDTDPIRIDTMFKDWVRRAKMITEPLDDTSDKYDELKREFNTMEVARCYKVNERGEPFSFDFTIETKGVLSIPYIVQRACEVGASMCDRYVNVDKGITPEEVTITSSDSRIIGYDFLFRGHDHTLGNLLQTWLVENHIEGTAEPKITFAGYSVPHPLRDEMILRIGVEDGEEATARKALAQACKGCSEMFRKLRDSWARANGETLNTQAPVQVKANGAVPLKRRVPKVAPATQK